MIPRKKILFIANNCIGTGLSGGDRIFTEFIRAWSDVLDVVLLGSEEAGCMASTRGIKEFRMLQSDGRNNSKNPYTISGMISHVLGRTRKGIKALGRYSSDISDCRTVYSVSDSYPDFLPAYILKKQNPSIRWIAGYYLFIPNPFDKESPYKGKNWLRGLMYWLLQTVSYRMVNNNADMVFVTSEPDVERFVTDRRDRSKVIVVQGGVDVTESERYLASNRAGSEEKMYDACFIGRLHYQKGILELIDIWDKVAQKKPGAKLAIIGDGQLDTEVREKIRVKRLDSCVSMLGFLDGTEKHEVFKKSRVMLHPAIYDSGGMACAEGMAWKIPAVSFDLEALKTYYPKGMLKTPKFDIAMFADNVLRLLDDKALYAKTAEDAHALVLDVWDWKKRARRIFEQMEAKQ